MKKHDTVTFSDSLPGSKDYWVLFQTTGWNDKYKLSEDELNASIQNSWYACSLYDSDKLIGFGRIICDGIFHALIVDLMIHPDYQGQGYGSQLLEKLVDKCKEHRVRSIQLFSAKGKFGFYEKYGFEKRASDAPGMQLK